MTERETIYRDRVLERERERGHLQGKKFRESESVTERETERGNLQG